MLYEIPNSLAAPLVPCPTVVAASSTTSFPGGLSLSLPIGMHDSFEFPSNASIHAKIFFNAHSMGGVRAQFEYNHNCPCKVTAVGANYLFQCRCALGK